MLATGQLYFDHYIRACKLQNVCLFFAILESSSTVRMNKGRTPVPSHHISRSSLDTRKAMIMDMFVEDPQNHQQAKANVSTTDHVIRHSPQISCNPFFKALVLDGFRCVISGLYDATSVRHNKELELELERTAGAAVCITECAHVFPESTNAIYLVAMRRVIRCVFPYLLQHHLLLACGQSWIVLDIRWLLRS